MQPSVKSRPTANDVHVPGPMTGKPPDKKYRVNGIETTLTEMARAWTEKVGADSVMIALYPSPEMARQLALNNPQAEAPEELHLTLCYFGQGVKDFQKLSEAVRLWASQQEPIEGRTNGIGRFTVEDGEDALYASYDAPVLPAFRQSLVQSLRAIGFEPDMTHGFTPHITLMYLDHNDPLPLQSLELIPVTFEYICCVMGEDVYEHYPLGREQVGKAGAMYKVNGVLVPIEALAHAFAQKQGREALKRAQEARAKKYGIAVRVDGALTIPARFARLGATDGDFADPVNYKFPVWLTESADSISPEKLGQVRNAPVRFGQFKANYDTRSRGVVQERIDRALRKFKVGEYAETKKGWRLEVIAKQEEQRLIYGVISEPDSVDAQDDIISAGEIERAAHNYMLKSRLNDLQHERILSNEETAPVESYIAPVDMNIEGTDIKKGSWLMCVKIFDDEIWQQVKDGEINAFSIRGVGVREPVREVH